MKFRKKPVVIEAMHYDGGNADEVISWAHAGLPPEANAKITRDYSVGPERPMLSIFTLEGIMFATPSDWIIKGVKGEFYPCKSDIFAATYEPAE